MSEYGISFRRNRPNLTLLLSRRTRENVVLQTYAIARAATRDTTQESLFDGLRDMARANRFASPVTMATNIDCHLGARSSPLPLNRSELRSSGSELAIACAARLAVSTASATTRIWLVDTARNGYVSEPRTRIMGTGKRMQHKRGTAFRRIMQSPARSLEVRVGNLNPTRRSDQINRL